MDGLDVLKWHYGLQNSMRQGEWIALWTYLAEVDMSLLPSRSLGILDAACMGVLCHQAG
jgi:hypothetical protein